MTKSGRLTELFSEALSRNHLCVTDLQDWKSSWILLVLLIWIEWVHFRKRECPNRRKSVDFEEILRTELEMLSRFYCTNTQHFRRFQQTQQTQQMSFRWYTDTFKHGAGKASCKAGYVPEGPDGHGRREQTRERHFVGGHHYHSLVVLQGNCCILYY